jgi:hypothetical protein
MTNKHDIQILTEDLKRIGILLGLLLGEDIEANDIGK